MLIALAPFVAAATWYYGSPIRTPSSRSVPSGLRKARPCSGRSRGCARRVPARGLRCLADDLPRPAGLAGGRAVPSGVASQRGGDGAGGLPARLHRSLPVWRVPQIPVVRRATDAVYHRAGSLWSGVSEGAGLVAYLPASSRRVVLPVMSTALAAAIALPVAGRVRREFDRGLASQRFEEAVRRPVGEWLRDHAPAEATVAMKAIGYQGYYANRHVVDLAGPWSVRRSCVCADRAGTQR